VAISKVNPVPMRTVSAARDVSMAREVSAAGKDVTAKPQARVYEMVTKGEFEQVRGKHRDLYRAVRDLKELSAGEGVKLKCLGTPQERARKRKAAIAIAARAEVHVRTMLRGDWLFIEKVKA
jgi:hypothetical protein